jgi:hypothetical protein
VALHFHGPFSAIDDTSAPCLFTNAIATEGGVYLRTINVHGDERPWYVGQTRRSFGERIAEHLAGFLTGAYAIFDPAALERGELRRVGPSPRTSFQMLPRFLHEYATLSIMFSACFGR